MKIEDYINFNESFTEEISSFKISTPLLKFKAETLDTPILRSRDFVYQARRPSDFPLILSERPLQSFAHSYGGIDYNLLKPDEYYLRSITIPQSNTIDITNSVTNFSFNPEAISASPDPTADEAVPYWKKLLKNYRIVQAGHGVTVSAKAKSKIVKTKIPPTGEAITRKNRLTRRGGK